MTVYARIHYHLLPPYIGIFFHWEFLAKMTISRCVNIFLWETKWEPTIASFFTKCILKFHWDYQPAKIKSPQKWLDIPKPDPFRTKLFSRFRLDNKASNSNAFSWWDKIWYCIHYRQDSGLDKENRSRWWGEDRENPRGEPLSLDRALASFPILTSSTWLIIYLAYLLSVSHCKKMFFVLWSR